MADQNSNRPLTRQGVRDLNDPPRNARKVPLEAACFHQWEHYSGCDGCSVCFLYENDDDVRHTYKCRRCGATKEQ